MTVEGLIPILRVSDLAASIHFYTHRLGFKLDWRHPAIGRSTSASVSKDGHAIMLCEGEQGQPGTWIWIGVDDVNPFFEECTTKGTKITKFGVFISRNLSVLRDFRGERNCSFPCHAYC